MNGMIFEYQNQSNICRCLDKAATISDSERKNDELCLNGWRICTVTQVEEVKILLRMVPIWATAIIYALAYAQAHTMFVEQGKTMNTNIGGLFNIPAASLYMFNSVTCMLWDWDWPVFGFLLLFSNLGICFLMWVFLFFCFLMFCMQGVPLRPVRDRPLEQFNRLYEDGVLYVYKYGHCSVGFQSKSYRHQSKMMAEQLIDKNKSFKTCFKHLCIGHHNFPFVSFSVSIVVSLLPFFYLQDF